MYYVLSVGGHGHCPLLEGSLSINAVLNSIRAMGLRLPLLEGSLSINAVLNSIRAMGFDHYIEVGRSSKVC